jgi:hypothetical protein
MSTLLSVGWLGGCLGPNGQGKSSSPTNKKAAQEKNLTIELRLPKSNYTTAESIDVDIVFRNDGNNDVKIPMCDGPAKNLFFDFLIVGDMGKGYLTDRGQGWGNPSVKPVKMINLMPGGSYSVHLEDVLPSQSYPGLGVHSDEGYKLLAIYRDHSYGHSPTYPEYGRNDPSVWKGIAFSQPVRIDSILRPTEAE